MTQMNEEQFFHDLQSATGRSYLPSSGPLEAVIGGLHYRTFDATHLALYEHSYEVFGNRWLGEDLYRTANGRFFLRVCGGPDSIHHIGRSGGGQIFPLDEFGAMYWLELRGLVEEYVKIFGDELEAA